ncbi:MAG: LysM peptidoglycan-binding domain-containing protein [Gammaproteobacteria bacterium]
MAMTRWLALGLVLLLCGGAQAGTVTLRPDHPNRYVVVKGDTLWGISARFLRDPWMWPEVWSVNPQIRNPHLIYPGDVIVLSYVNGKPQLRLGRAAAGATTAPAGERTVVLHPEVRREPLPKAIPTIPMSAILPFLTRPDVVAKGELKAAPYVVEIANEHLVGASGSRIYVRRLTDPAHRRYAVVREGGVYRNPKTQEILGYEAIHLADATLITPGDPATLRLTRVNQEVLTGDRLVPLTDQRVEENFTPHAPKQPVDGQIISVFHGVSQIGQDQVVVLDVGRRDGVRVGDVLAIYQTGARIRDTVEGGLGKTVQLPDERAGLLMVFRPFERVSYALVMSATRAIHLDDTVRNP